MTVFTLGVPLAAFFPAAWLARGLVNRWSASASRWRGTLLVAAIIWSIGTVIGTEALAVMRWLTPFGVATWWLVFGVVCAALAWVLGQRSGCAGRPTKCSVDASLTQPDVRWSSRVVDGLLATVLALALGLALIAALYSPPNTIDALTYHLPRQVMWLQQRSVEHFPTNNVRQVMMPPLAEFMQLQFMAITGSDRFANLTSWFAVALTSVAASVLALQLGADRRGQLLAAVFVVLIPMVFVQASTSKNDVTLALWITLACVAVAALFNRELRPWSAASLLGSTVGLGVLTKGTAIVFLAPLVVAFILLVIKRAGRSSLAPLVFSALLASAINVGHFTRNALTFGHPGGPLTTAEGGYPVFNELHSPAAMVSSVVKNLALSMGTPFDSANEALNDSIAALHRAIDIDPNDPRMTYPKGRPFEGVVWAPHGNGAPGSPVHLALAISVLAISPILWRRSLCRRAMLGFGLCVAGYLLFAVVFRWQLSHSRLLIPATVAVCAPLAVLVARTRWKIGAVLSVAAMLVVLAPTARYGARRVIGNESVLSVAEEDQLLRLWPPDDRAAFTSAMDRIARMGPSQILLATHGNAPDYTIMRALRSRMEVPPRFIYVPESFESSARPARDVLVRSTDVGRPVHVSKGPELASPPPSPVTTHHYRFEFDIEVLSR